MTCIVGIIDKINNCVIIGGDSAGVSGLDVSIRRDPKVFKVDKFIFGGTTSFRMIQLIMFSFQPPPFERDAVGFRKSDAVEDLFQYMCTTFVDSLRECFKKGGFGGTTNLGETGGSFLIGYKNRLFFIDNDFQVGELEDGFCSVGCGEQYANATMKALSDNTKISAREIAREALKNASYYSGGVCEPFRFVDTME